jgi:SAM-dependent methyltransferase
MWKGEQAALDRIRDEVRGSPILDIGVGTGRTIPLLRDLTSDYRAVDYLPSMVDTARARFPGTNVEVGDARSLEGLPSKHFGLVNFSFNGIDAVGAADRRRVLDAVLRVLRPGGVFFFSTLNLDGPDYRERPWHIGIAPAKNPLRMGVRAARALGTACLDMWSWMKVRDATEVGPGYAVAPLRAHHYGVLAHFTTLERELDELASAGFDRDVEVLDHDTGARVTPGADVSSIAWFHLLARRAADSALD